MTSTLQLWIIVMEQCSERKVHVLIVPDLSIWITKPLPGVTPHLWLMTGGGRTSSLSPSLSPTAWTSSLSCFINLIQTAENTFAKISRFISGDTVEMWKMSVLSMEKRTQLTLSRWVSSDRRVDATSLTYDVKELQCSQSWTSLSE